MIQSMTGFGKAQGEFNSIKITVEVKSLNSRNADIKLKIPNHYREKELVIRNLIVKHLDRGKVDFSLSVFDQENTLPTSINKDRFKAYFNELKALAAETNAERVDVFGMALRMPEVIESNEQALNAEEWKASEKVIEEALKNLNSFRTREGKEMEEDFMNRNAAILSALSKVEKLAPERANQVEERLHAKLEELENLQDADKQRMHQEIVYYLEKFDINEEIVRLKSHCSHFADTINEDQSQGKKLGFIGQEMGREINTIGSKANHAEIQKLVVGMKDELEKIKEQVLNIL